LFQQKSGGRSTSNAFLLPQWGGIVIHNPPSGNVESADLSPQDLNLYFSSFSNQLLALLGVAKLPLGLEHSKLHHTDVLSDWQLDALLRRRAFENAQGSQDTLSSIVKLIDRIENMPVGDGVRDDVQNALHALMKASDYSKCGHDYLDFNEQCRCSIHQVYPSTRLLPIRLKHSPWLLVLSSTPAC
jgi:phosphatidylinositol glycan class S